MKTLQKYFGLMVFVAGLIIATHSSAGGVCRNFTDTRGRTVKGQLMGFDDLKQLVTIQRADNQVAARARLADFSAPDQHYIQTWNFEHEFNHALSISVSRKTFRKPNTVHGKRDQAEYIKNIGYEVKLENPSTTRFESVEIEYCVFYRQGGRKLDRLNFDEGVQCGRLKVGSIEPDSSQYLKTEPVLVLDESGPAGLFGRSEGVRGEVLGVWLRVHVASPSGIVLTKESVSPAGLGDFKDWTCRTIRVGLNK